MDEFTKHTRGHSTDGWEVGLWPSSWRPGKFDLRFFDPENKKHDGLTKALKKLGLKKLTEEKLDELREPERTGQLRIRLQSDPVP